MSSPQKTQLSALVASIGCKRSFEEAWPEVPQRPGQDQSRTDAVTDPEPVEDESLALNLFLKAENEEERREVDGEIVYISPAKPAATINVDYYSRKYDGKFNQYTKLV